VAILQGVNKGDHMVTQLQELGDQIVTQKDGQKDGPKDGKTVQVVDGLRVVESAASEVKDPTANDARGPKAQGAKE
jgi:hypothetical protein